MNGPTFEIKFKKNKEYYIPRGYGFSGNSLEGKFDYSKGKFIGTLKQGTDNYFVFNCEDKFVICEPSQGVLGHKIHIYLYPKGAGLTMEEAIGNLRQENEYKWETYSDSENYRLSKFREILRNINI